MISIRCTANYCGEVIGLDYLKGTRVSSLTGSYYEWVCDKCGQPYRIIIKDPIYVTE